jgi:hypothetical protein
MPPYSWIHLESLFWVLAGGLIVASAIILARASRVWSFSLKKRTDKEIEEETHEFAGILSEGNRPVPIFIWLVIVGYFIWATAYVVFSGIRGL